VPVYSGVHGWVVIDKPLGMTSSRAVQSARRSIGGKAGHAGTLDPLATGVLPIAFGEATKTAQYATAGRKRYRFRIRWGEARSTDDGEGEVVAEDASRPNRAAIEGVLPRFSGRILQRPPAYSALKVAGRRAYALARAERPVELSARHVEIDELRLLALLDSDHADFEAVVGKGTYIRALARDLAEVLGTVGHVAELRRLSVGRFNETQAISLDSLATLRHSLAASGHLLPIEAALDDIPALALTAAEAARLRHGQHVIPADPVGSARLDQLEDGTIVSARHDGRVVALARVEGDRLRPVRVINC
jgi:tRNA pseudouridine55 synthase